MMDLNLSRRAVLKNVGLGAISAGAVATFQETMAQSSGTNWPQKPVRFIVPFVPGGTSDIVSRTTANEMTKFLPYPVVIENKAGAAGVIAADYVAKQPADGYTLLFGNSGPSATASLMRKLPYDIQKDFRPLSGVVRVPLILAVSADSPYKTLPEFLAWARKEGDKLNYGSTGIGGSSHLASEFFNELAGTKFQHIPYAGGAPLVTAFASVKK